MEEFYDDLFSSNVTIPNEFLEKYLSDTKSEYIKVFLFYLWKGVKEGYTIEDASNEIDLGENVIEMALKYWIKKKIMKKECLIKNKVEKESTKDKTENLVDFQTKKKELISKNRKSYDEIERDLLFVAEKLLGQTVSERQERLIAKCYNEYGFDEGLIQYLLEFCSNNNSKAANYMATVASSWYEEGIKSVDAAKKYVEKFESQRKAKSIKAIKSNSKSNIINRKEYDQKLIDSMLNGKYKV